MDMALLHDHLDGGLRTTTLVELAEEVGYRGLPSQEPDVLAEHLDQSQAGSLDRYLAAFDHTVAVMASPVALHRVARETIVDLAADGVVYAEVRFAPALTAAHGLGIEESVEAVCDGLAAGGDETGVEWGYIVDALRHRGNSEEVVRRVLAARVAGVVGFDLAGPEAGFPPSLHREACRLAREGGLRLTIHAGEAAGPSGPTYMAEAVELGAERLGHGVEIMADCRVEGGRIVDLGAVASMIHDRGIVLEVCPTSNAATGNIPLPDHPLPLLYEAGFAVTVNTDNRLMSRTSMSAEMKTAAQVLGMSDEKLVAMNDIAIEGAFCDEATKSRLRSRSG